MTTAGRTAHPCNHAFTPHPPQLFTTMTLRGYAGAGLAFKLYAVAGPTAKLEAYTGARGQGR